MYGSRGRPGTGNDGVPLMKSKSVSFGPIYGAESGTSSKKRLLLIFGAGIVLLGGMLLLISGFRGGPGREAQQPPFENFISVDGVEFKDGADPFYIVGFNIDSIMEAAIPEVSSRTAAAGLPTGREKVRNVLQQASKSGLNVLRMWAHTTNPDYPLQETPGKYNENVFEALDFVVTEAGAAGIRVVLSLADQWRYKGGVAEFTDWSPYQPPRDPRYPPLIIQGDVTPESMTPERTKYEHARQNHFFTDSGAKDIYKGHMKAILNRRNKFTGLQYKDDPTIMAFGLLNEPRCYTEESAGCTDDLQAWVSEMATYFKSLDQKHLLTIGQEGFFGSSDASVSGNPGAFDGSTWAAEQGQDFSRNHAVKGIDYTTIHIWPDNWFQDDDEKAKEFMANWINYHKRKSEELKKPLVLEEFGRKLEPSPADPNQIASVRDPIMNLVYRRVESSLANAETLQGSLLWELNFKVYEESPGNPYGVDFEDSTFDIVKDHARRVHVFRGIKRGSECFVYQSGLLTSTCVPAREMCDKLKKGHAAWDAEFDDVPFNLANGQEMMDLYGSREECCKDRKCGLRFP